MRLDPNDLQITAWPPQENEHLGVPRGVKVVHLPTGAEAVCLHYRTQFRNKAVAIQAILTILEFYGREM